MSKKIDNTGKYKPFAGLTVVADVFQLNAELFLNFHRKLSENALIVEHCGLLPPESYHITSFSVIEQEFQNWTELQFYQWIQSNSKQLERTHQELESSTHGFTFKLSVDRRRLTLWADIETKAAHEQLTVAESVSLVARVPSRFHITLGYQYKQASKATTKLIYEATVACLQECLPNYENTVLYALKPKLCYYHDMTEFISWNGRGNPFVLNRATTPAVNEGESFESQEISANNAWNLDDVLVFE